MPPVIFRRELGLPVLCLGVILTTVLFGLRAQHSPGVYYLLAIAQLAVIGTGAWKLGASSLLDSTEATGTLAAAGLLLIAPWLFFALVPGLGTPWQATAAENLTRYIVLFSGALAVGLGMIFLREALAAAGEKLYSTLGFALILFATPLYLVWAAILYEANFVRAQGAELTPSMLFVTDFSDLLLYFGGLLTYLASAAFAASTARTALLGRVFSRVLIISSLLAAFFLIIRGPRFPDPTRALALWYNVPGFVFGIPAIPWLVSCALGIALLRRAGREKEVV